MRITRAFILFTGALVMTTPVAAQRVPASARQQDLTYVSTTLPSQHPNFFFQLDRSIFQKAADSLNQNLATASDAEFYVGLAQLVALAGDAHTTISLSGNAASPLGFQTLPLTFRWLDDGVFVTAAAPAYSRALRTQLVAVGGMPIDQVMQRLGTVIPHGNDQWLHYMAQQYLTGQQILQGLHILPVTTTSDFSFRSPAGEQFTLQLAPDSSAQVTAPDSRSGPLPAWIQNPVPNYWYSYSAPNRLLYFRYNRCSDDPSSPFSALAAKILDTIDHNPVDSFVFDLRGNTGGSDSVWDPLALGLQQRLPTLVSNARFHFYVIIDKGTFSSGMDDAMELKQPLPADFTSLFPSFDFAQLVRVVGEPTGGKPAEYGQVQGFTLPGSRLAGQYSTKYFSNPSYVPDLPSFLPDVAVSMRSTDYFARHDPAMAAILARTTGLPAPPSGEVITVNGASFRVDQGVAPGSIAAAFGAFSSTPDQVFVGSVPGQILAAAATQVNFVVPVTVPPGNATVSLCAAGKEIAKGQVTISQAGPGILILNPADPAQPGAVENQDYSVNSPDAPAKAGSVVQIFATGNGPVDGNGSAPVQVYFGDIPAQVLFSAPLAQFPGLWQINAIVPPGLTGQVPLEIVAGGLFSNGVTISVQ